MNPMNSSDGVVDQVIGSAYQVVKYVAENMEEIAQLAESVAPLVDAAADLSIVADDMASVNTVAANMPIITANAPAIATVSTNITKVVTVADNVADVRTVASNIAKVNAVADNIGPLLSSAAPTREALRRTYAEAGYNLVAGSFEAGGVLVGLNDVLLQETTGKVYSGPAGSVTAGTLPQAPTWVPVIAVILRGQLAANTGATMIGDSNFGTVFEGTKEVLSRVGSYSQAQSASINKTDTTVFKDSSIVATLQDSLDTPNGYSIFASALPTKKWIAADKGMPIDIRRFKQSGSGWTEALQKAFDNKEPVKIPAGSFTFDGTANFTDTPVVEGVNRKLSWLKSGVGLPIIRNKNSATTTALFGKISNVGLTTVDGYTGNIDRGLIDMKSCQFFRVEDVWFFGNGSTLSIGAYVEAVLNVTEASYNLFSNVYSGNLKIGLYIGGVANSNRIEYGRFQPGSGCFGVYVDPGTAYVDDLTIFASGFEYPGAVGRGVFFNGDASTKSIHTVNITGGNRFEQLLAGVSGAGVRDLICDERENYFDSCTSNIAMTSSRVKPTDFADALMLNGTLTSSIGITSVSNAQVGVYELTLDRPHGNMVSALVGSEQPETTYELVGTHVIRIKTFSSTGVASASVRLSVTVKKFY